MTFVSEALKTIDNYIYRYVNSVHYNMKMMNFLQKYPKNTTKLMFQFLTVINYEKKIEKQRLLVPEQDGVDSLFLTYLLQPNSGDNSTDNSQRTIEAERRQTGWGLRAWRM